LGNNGWNFGRNLNYQTSYLLIYKCEVAKLGSIWKERGGERQKEIEIDIERGGERDRKKER
jgi:hypothetical protein